MTGVLRLAWSVACSGWRANWNRSVRFSKMKSALIVLAIQALFFLFIARRAPAMQSGRTQDSLGALFILLGTQMAWFGMMYGFSRGQFQLYQGTLVPLFQITPARPLAFLIGRVIESIPQRAWSTVLWAWVYSGVIPGGSRWALALLLGLYGLMIGTVAHLSGLLLLTFWSRYSARTMRNGLLLFGAMTLVLATWAVIFLSRGGTVTELAWTMRQYRMTAGTAIALVGGIPGLLLFGALLLRPQMVENLYRAGLYNVIELNETDIARPLRSVWLPVGDGVLRAVLSREWLQLGRSRVARVQAMIFLAGTVGVYVAGQSMAGQPLPRLVQFIGGLSLLSWFLSFGHWVVRAFEQERVTIALYRLAAIPTWKLLLAKIVSIAVPSILLVAISALAGCLGAGLSFSESLPLLLWSMSGLLAGIAGGFGMTAATADEEPAEPEITAGPRRDMGQSQGADNAWWALARTGALVVTAALPIWTRAGQPGLGTLKIPTELLLAVDLLLPLVLLVIGARLMVRMWARNA